MQYPMTNHKKPQHIDLLGLYLMNSVKKIVLAYSGGLDTSVILTWLLERYPKCEVVTFTANIGQDDDLSDVESKALSTGATKVYIEDLRETFVRDFVFPMFRANTVYEGEYLLGTSIARPLIAQQLVKIAEQENADAIAHGATGKGNDQVRFELSAYALMPDIKVIAPWREWDLLSREKLVAYADAHKIPVSFQKRSGQIPFSMDANLLHISYEGGVLEDPGQEPPEQGMWRLTSSIENAPSTPEEISLTFHKGDLVAIDGTQLPAHALLDLLNQKAGRHGIGRLDLVENRYVGMKSRGCYETPGGTLLLKAHRAIESITLDREVAHLKDELMPRYAKLIYNGYWWAPERLALQALIDYTQTFVNGTVVLRMLKGNIQVVSRQSSDSLFDPAISTFEDDAGAYNQSDAEGFIKLNALRMRIAGRQRHYFS